MPATTALDHLASELPDLAAAGRTAGALGRRLGAASFNDAADAFEEWLRLRASIEAARALAHVRHRLDTSNPERALAQDRLDESEAHVRALDANFARHALASFHLERLEKIHGPVLIERLRQAADGFRPELAADLRAEARLVTVWRATFAEGTVAIGGEADVPLALLGPRLVSPDRATRRAAFEARLDFLVRWREELDSLFTRLFAARRRLGEAGGFADFLEARAPRVGYSDEEVELAEGLAAGPLAATQAELFRIRAAALGIEQVLAWDERIVHREGNARVPASAAAAIRRTREALEDLRFDAGAAALLERIVAGRFFDLDARPAKDATPLAADLGGASETPFVAAAWDGTSRGLLGLLHALGAAIAPSLRRAGDPDARDRPPPPEAAALPALAFPVVLFPALERLAGETADRLRLEIVADLIDRALEGFAIWRFERAVYGEPELPYDIAGAWRDAVEARLPWRTAEGQPPELDEVWRSDRRLVETPGRAIDEAFAAIAALQLWAVGRKDLREALDRYRALVATGGALEWMPLLGAAGLAPPFETGALDQVASELEWLTDEARR